MISRLVLRTLRLTVVLLLFVMPILWLKLGAAVSQSFFFGFAAASLSVFSFAYFAKAMTAGGAVSPKASVAASTAVMLLKLPLLALICFVGLAPGGTPRVYFLFGAAMVYSALIAFACMDLKSAG